jgi:hypothetical protein
MNVVPNWEQLKKKKNTRTQKNTGKQGHNGGNKPVRLENAAVTAAWQSHNALRELGTTYDIAALSGSQFQILFFHEFAAYWRELRSAKFCF